MKKDQDNIQYENYSFGLGWSVIVVICFVWYHRFFKGVLPTMSIKENPKLEYDAWSGVFYWDDEGGDDFRGRKIDIFKSMLLYRTFLLENKNTKQVKGLLKVNRWIFHQIKKRNPNWIGFDEKRCSYSPEVAGRMRRIRKVAEWRIEKIFNE